MPIPVIAAVAIAAAPTVYHIGAAIGGGALLFGGTLSAFLLGRRAGSQNQMTDNERRLLERLRVAGEEAFNAVTRFSETKLEEMQTILASLDTTNASISQNGQVFNQHLQSIRSLITTLERTSNNFDIPEVRELRTHSTELQTSLNLLVMSHQKLLDALGSINLNFRIALANTANLERENQENLQTIQELSNMYVEARNYINNELLTRARTLSQGEAPAPQAAQSIEMQQPQRPGLRFFPQPQEQQLLEHIPTNPVNATIG